MHSFTRPSYLFVHKIKVATYRSLHHTILYRRLVLQFKGKEARICNAGQAIYKRLRTETKKGTKHNELESKQLFIGKLAPRYDHAPTDACPFCGSPNKLLHISQEYIRHTPATLSVDITRRSNYPMQHPQSRQALVTCGTTKTENKRLNSGFIND